MLVEGLLRKWSVDFTDFNQYLLADPLRLPVSFTKVSFIKIYIYILWLVRETKPDFNLFPVHLPMHKDQIQMLKSNCFADIQIIPFPPQGSSYI